MSDLSAACSIEDLRRLAKRRLPRGVFDFFDGGAEDEVTLAQNRLAFERLRLYPKVLVDVQNPDLSTEVLGTAASVPLVIAPTGAIGAGWPNADIAIARAARDLGIPYTLSTTATSSIEQIARCAGGRLWFQLYILHDRQFNNRLIDRAYAAGYEALVVTLDLATGGKRERDVHNRFTVPLRPNLKTVVDFATHPRWLLRLLRGGFPQFENLRDFQGRGAANAAVAALVGQNLDAGFNWSDMQQLRDRWKGRLIAKGVARGDDAARLVELGVDGIWVSNHGGRQLDGAIAAADALPDIAEAVGGQVPLLIDSGVRRGVDIIKALALGAQAAAIGRATLYGAAAGGEPGARRALAILVDELKRSMQLCGVSTTSAIGSDLLQAKKRLPQTDKGAGEAAVSSAFQSLHG